MKRALGALLLGGLGLAALRLQPAPPSAVPAAPELSAPVPPRAERTFQPDASPAPLAPERLKEPAPPPPAAPPPLSAGSLEEPARVPAAPRSDGEAARQKQRDRIAAIRARRDQVLAGLPQEALIRLQPGHIPSKDILKRGGYVWTGPVVGMSPEEIGRWAKESCPSGFWFGYVDGKRGPSVACQRNRHCCETQMKTDGGPKCVMQMFSTGSRASGGNLGTRRER